MIYCELKDKNLDNMWKVMLYGTAAATVAYCLAGIFGYVTFAMNPNVVAIMNA